MSNDDKQIVAALAVTEIGDQAAFYIHVTTKDELAKALHERKSPIIIGDKKLARPFEWLLWSKELRSWAKEAWWWFLVIYLMGAISQAMLKGHRVELRGGWDIGRHVNGEIILTPQRPPSPPSATGEE
jgi:hypothetical protein